jgi:hypothetical protein
VSSGSSAWDWIYATWSWVSWLIGADKAQAAQIADLQRRVRILETRPPGQDALEFTAGPVEEQ